MRTLNSAGLDLLFREARTPEEWLDRPVADEILRDLYDLVKLGPTSSNCSPARFLFLRSAAAKARLKPAINPANLEKTMLAPVTAIVGYDIRYHERMPVLFPEHAERARERYTSQPGYAEATAFRNSSVQGGYLILAARSLGLDCMPVSGFNNAKVDEQFFGTGEVKSNFICNLGYGAHRNLEPRKPRLAFDEACELL
ncbi:MAG: malonic semialdehyde reductase [Acidobacteria bacterium RIFCSPLOWO2_02_FULL_59_13]|nr:MAG: malonic semialdehyde reductase [Acidobacteria bacterium RIFCSPLOWO2_02_FULL_59_13]